METTSVLEQQVKTADRKIRTELNNNTMSSKSVRKNSPAERLSSEIDENFMNYLNYHGLAGEENMVVLSSQKHYYYDYDELKGITTLINCKKLNLIKHLNDFLNQISNGLAPKTNFIGCFTESNSKNENTATRLYKRFLNFLDSKTDYEIDRDDFSKMIESCGFKVIDMTEINGLTYFRTQN